MRTDTLLGPLSQLLGLTQGFSCALVVWGSRLAGRYIVSDAHAEALEALLSAQGVSVVRAPFRYQHRPERRGGGLVAAGAETDAVVYVGTHPDFATGAMHAEVLDAHRLLARVLGFPGCCAEAWTERDELTDRAREARAADGAGPFPALLSPALQVLLGFRLITHFPCRFDCPASQELADHRLRLLIDHIPSAAHLPRFAPGMLLHAPGLGWRLAREVRPVDADSVALHRWAPRTPGREGALLRIQPGGFVLDDVRWMGPEVYAGHFV